MGVGISHYAGGYRSAGPGQLELVVDRKMGNHCPRVRQNLQIDPRTTSPRSLAQLPQAKQQPADGGGISTPGGVVSTQGISGFIPGLLEL